MYFGIDIDQAVDDAAEALDTANAAFEAQLAAAASAGSTPAPVATAFISEADRWVAFGDGESNAIETGFLNRWVVCGFNRLPDLNFDDGRRWFVSADIQVKDTGTVMTYEVYSSEFGEAPPSPGTLRTSIVSSGLNTDGEVLTTPEFELNAGLLPAIYVVKTTSPLGTTFINRARIYGVRWNLRRQELV